MLGPDFVVHIGDCLSHPDVARMGHDLATMPVHQLLGGLLTNASAPPADVDFGAELQKPFRHFFAKACAAAGDKDALTLHQAILEHEF